MRPLALVLLLLTLGGCTYVTVTDSPVSLWLQCPEVER